MHIFFFVPRQQRKHIKIWVIWGPPKFAKFHCFSLPAIGQKEVTQGYGVAICALVILGGELARGYAGTNCRVFVHSVQWAKNSFERTWAQMTPLYQCMSSF